MLQVFFGTDVIAVRDEVQRYVARREVDGVQVSRLEASTYEPGQLEHVLGATSLFGESLVCVIDSPHELAAFKAEVDSLLQLLAHSATDFVVVYGNLLAADKKRLTASGATLHELSTFTKPRENTFALAEALARKDKKAVWVLYQEAVRAGKTAEEIVGLLWWQLKALRLASLTHNATEAGMKDYPYQKAKQALKHFTPLEIESLSSSLLSVYHNGHAGQQDIDLALEAWILSLK